MKAKEEAADQAQPLISDTTDSVIKGSDQSPADEVERVALQAIIDVRRRAAASFEEGFTGARGQAYDRAVLDCHDAVRAALSAIRNTPQAIEAGEVEQLVTDDLIVDITNLVTDLADAEALELVFPELRTRLEAFARDVARLALSTQGEGR